ncbi:glycoside hydrolase family 64 protein [Hortaea werneckii]|nr:glycoside hydrolase family 64 protein [Hortaea werneckii]
MLDLLHIGLALALTAQHISAAPLNPRQETTDDFLEDVHLEDAELADVTVENPTYSSSGLLTGGLLINGTIINATIANASDDHTGLTVSSNNTVNATAPAPSSSSSSSNISLPIRLPTSSSLASSSVSCSTTTITVDASETTEYVTSTVAVTMSVPAEVSSTAVISSSSNASSAVDSSSTADASSTSDTSSTSDASSTLTSSSTTETSSTASTSSTMESSSTASTSSTTSTSSTASSTSTPETSSRASTSSTVTPSSTAVSSSTEESSSIAQTSSTVATSSTPETSSTVSTSSTPETSSTASTSSIPETSSTASTSSTSETSSTLDATSTTSSTSSTSTSAEPTSTSASATSTTTSSPSQTSLPANDGVLKLSFVNNIGSGDLRAYVTGQDDEGRIVMVQRDGTFFYPDAQNGEPQLVDTTNIAFPLNGVSFTNEGVNVATVDPDNTTETTDTNDVLHDVSPAEVTNLTIPDFMIGARIWLSVGELQFYSVLGANGMPSLVEPSPVSPRDPSANVSWGFVEYTINEAGIYADISYVDFMGLPLGIILESENTNVQSALGPEVGSVQDICNDLAGQAAIDGQPWDRLCVYNAAGNPLRVLSPVDYLTLDPDAFNGYYDSYVDSVWERYTSEPLTIMTQSSAGPVNCTVDSTTNLLNCDGDNRAYAQPTANDIFSCNSGPFAIESGDNAIHLAVVPRLCAAFNRGTLLLEKGNATPTFPMNVYYTNDGPKNWYSAFVHRYEADGKGYAFAYDDVVPDGGADSAGLTASPDPEVLTVVVGGSTIRE